LPKSHGSRRRTRSLLKSPSAKKGLSSLLVEYSPHDKVVIKIDPTQVKGMPHRRFNGLVGTVTEVGRRAVTVDVNVGNKVKKLVARKEHVVRMEGS
jgi:large subunit ribosomal protein L21e